MEVEPGKSFLDNLAQNSLAVIEGPGEPCPPEAKEGGRFQFERLGYFVRDPDNALTGGGVDGKPVFNKTVGLRDTWAKIAKKN
jgi:glutaminyl-tRNA synthetase